MICGVLPVLNQITAYLWAYSWRVFFLFLPFAVGLWLVVLILYLIRRKNRKK